MHLDFGAGENQDISDFVAKRLKISRLGMNDFANVL